MLVQTRGLLVSIQFKLSSHLVLVLQWQFSFKCTEISFQRTTRFERRTIDKRFLYTDGSLLDIAVFVKEKGRNYGTLR